MLHIFHNYFIWLGSLFLFSIVGSALNYYNVPFYFGVDFLFGSIVVWIVLHFFGIFSSVFVATLASLVTIYLWGHPYAAIVLILESIVVGQLYQKKQGNLILLNTLYWVLLGAPLVFIFYKFVLNVATMSAILIVLKQSFNGIFNSLIGFSLVVLISRFKATNLIKKQIRFSDALLVLFLLFTNIPILYINFSVARTEFEDMSKDTINKLHIISNQNDFLISEWLKKRSDSIVQLAEFVKDKNISIQELQLKTEIITKINKEFHNMYIADKHGTTIAFYPPTNEKKQSTIGLNFADREYYKKLKECNCLVISDIFIGRGGIFEPIITISYPIQKNNEFDGFVLAAIRINELTKILDFNSSAYQVNASLVDQTNIVIASTEKNIKPLSKFTEYDNIERKKLIDGFYQLLPTKKSNMTTIHRWKESKYVYQRNITGYSRWILYSEFKLAPFQDELYIMNIKNLSILLSILLITLSISIPFSRYLVSDIQKMNKITLDIPNKIKKGESIEWPSISINEINVLCNRFKKMTESLNEQFHELEENRIHLENRIEERTADLYETNQQLEIEKSKLKEAKEMAEIANQAKSAFLASMSHELRTPLNGVLGYAQILLMDNTLSFNQKESIHTIYRSGEHLLTLLNDILDLSKIEAGKMELNFTNFELNTLLRSIIDVFLVQAQKKKNQLVFESNIDESLIVNSDEKRIRQILFNLLGNALKFTDSGQVKLKVFQDNDKFRFEVQDTGIGISKEDQNSIFEAFKQVGKLKQKSEGTGLGLTISKRLIEILNGTLSIESEINKGSIFSFELSLIVAQNIKTVKSKELPILDNELKLEKLKILIADDEPINRRICIKVLSKYQFDLYEAENGADAYEKTKLIRPDIILMDLVMPLMSGIDATIKIRETEETKNTYIIALSANAFLEDRQKCMETGFNSFVAKPFKIDELIQEIKLYKKED